MRPLGVVAAALTLAVLAARGDELQDLKKENAELRQRLERVETVLAEMQKTLPPGPDRPVRAGVDLRLYGMLKLDAAYDDSRVDAGNFARWVASEGVLDNDAHFNMTANQTRLGLDVLGPPIDGIATRGKVEIDFYGAGAGENKPDPMLRHAYVNLDWPAWRFSVLAGQTSDIISPLFPNTVNYSVGWWQGNIGYRRPQIRLTKSVALAEDVELKLEAGPTRTITGRKFVFKDATDPDTGADAGFPTAQGRASLTFPVGGKRQATVGFSGHYGGEEQHDAHLNHDHEYDTWSVNVDLRVPVTAWLLVQAEGFLGENLDSYLGGIGQGFDTNTVDTVASVGGWVAATLTPAVDWQFNAGAGVDNPADGDLSAGARARNWFVFGNAFYSLTANLQLALEVMYLRTTYVAQAAGDAWREQFAVIYKF